MGEGGARGVAVAFVSSAFIGIECVDVNVSNHMERCVVATRLGVCVCVCVHLGMLMLFTMRLTKSVGIG
jgi:hypothetical protein